MRHPTTDNEAARLARNRSEDLFLAKMRSGGEMDLIYRLGGGLGSSFRLGIGCSVTADQNKITAKRRVSGYRAHFSRRFILNFDQGCPTQQFRQHDCSDDAGHPALASMSPRDRRREFPLLHDPQAFPFLARDGCDPRDSSGRIRSSGVSDAAH